MSVLAETRLRNPEREDKAEMLLGLPLIGRSTLAAIVSDIFSNASWNISKTLNNPRLSSCIWSSGDGESAGYREYAREKSAAVIVKPPENVPYMFCKKDDLEHIKLIVNDLCRHIRMEAEFPSFIANVYNLGNRDLRTAGYAPQGERANFTVAGQEFCRFNVVLTSAQTARFSPKDAGQIAASFDSCVGNNTDALQRLIPKLDLFIEAARLSFEQAKLQEFKAAESEKLRITAVSEKWQTFAKTLGMDLDFYFEQPYRTAVKFQIPRNNFSQQDSEIIERELEKTQQVINNIFKAEGINISAGMGLSLSDQKSDAVVFIRLVDGFSNKYYEPPIIEAACLARIKSALSELGGKLS